MTTNNIYYYVAQEGNEYFHFKAGSMDEAKDTATIWNATVLKEHKTKTAADNHCRVLTNKTK